MGAHRDGSEKIVLLELDQADRAFTIGSGACRGVFREREGLDGNFVQTVERGEEEVGVGEGGRGCGVCGRGDVVGGVEGEEAEEAGEEAGVENDQKGG